MIRVSEHIRERVINTYGRFFEGICRLPAIKCGSDVLDEEKVHDQIALFCQVFELEQHQLRGLRLLEVGSGFGILLAVLRRDYGVETFGVEPASQGFNTSYEISRDVLRDYGMDAGIVRNAVGEHLPFEDNSFDLVFSSTVLEHTQDPARVLAEAIRVLKPGGRMQFVYPNYGSFFDGHYVVPWIPYMPRWIARSWVRIWGRDPAFINTLQLTNYFRTRRWLRPHQNIRVVTYGESIFRDRMLNLKIKNWAGLGRLRQAIVILHQIRLARAITSLLILMRSFEPIILSVEKQPPPSSSS